MHHEIENKKKKTLNKTKYIPVYIIIKKESLYGKMLKSH